LFDDVASTIHQSLYYGGEFNLTDWNHAAGKAVQVEPMKPILKAHETNRLTLKCDKLLSSFAFNFSLRRYT